MRIGLDVGGTKTDGVIVAPGGSIVARMRRPTGWGADGVVESVFAAAEELARAAGVSVDDVASLGVGMPGQVAPGSATVRHAVNLGVEELDLQARVADVLGIRVAAENDVKAAALGAYALHGGVGSVGYLNLGTGIAAGIVRDGVLWRGAHGTAGEVGHVSVDPSGPECGCGQRGCIEVFAGGAAVARQWGRPGTLPVRDVFDAADAGDPVAAELRERLAYGVASAIRVIVLTTDVDSVVLGGGVTALGDRMLEPVIDQLARSAAASPFLRSLRLSERIELLPAGSPAAALGAALMGAAAHEQEAVAHG
jgi:glucokinase